MSSIQEIQSKLNSVIQEIKIKVLKAIEIEVMRSIEKNFRVGGRPRWIPSKKKGKLKGTNTLLVSGRLSRISAVRNDANSTVTLSPNADARAYARIHQVREHRLEGLRKTAGVCLLQKEEIPGKQRRLMLVSVRDI